MNADAILEKLVDIGIGYGPKLIGAIVILLLGLWIIKLFTKSLRKMMNKRNTNKELRSFFLSLVNIALKVLLFVSVLGMVGIEVTSFIAILGAAGLAIGMALQGSLQNFAGGVIIILLKPFKVGDVLEAQGYLGIVKEIQIFSTILTTFDNKTIIIPNGGLATSSMTNYSTESLRRVDWLYQVAYGDDIDKVKALCTKLIENDSRILKEPAAFIAVNGLKDSSVEVAVRVWVKSEDYWAVFHSMNENVYNTFRSEGLHLPYPQMDVHLHNSK
ncbi:MAG TPA: mechanosensitive ion channel [Bacteroidales bacterium]|mgnify:CR=1 FL=1|nr:mechanosensitive ion channel [Bacteroidales bacterium]HQP04113.1 mechanosensitive ion channel [Bacteroidales bacterium]